MDHGTEDSTRRAVTQHGLLIIALSRAIRILIAAVVAALLLTGTAITTNTYLSAYFCGILFGTIPYCVGLLVVYAGRSDISREHERLMNYCVIIHVLMIVSYVLFNVVLWGEIALTMPLYVSFSIATLILGMAAKFTMLYHLLERNHRMMLYLTTALPVVLYLVFWISSTLFNFHGIAAVLTRFVVVEFIATGAFMVTLKLAYTDVNRTMIATVQQLAIQPEMMHQDTDSIPEAAFRMVPQGYGSSDPDSWQGFASPHETIGDASPEEQNS